MSSIKTAIAFAAALALVATTQAQASLNNGDAPAYGRLGSSASTGGGASAQVSLVADVDHLRSVDELGAAGNVVLVFDTTPGARVDALAFDLRLVTMSGSWLSEAQIGIINSAGQGVWINPGVGLDRPGSADLSGAASLASLGLAFNVGSDGKLMFQFYESYDDVAGQADAQWLSGKLSLGVAPVPEPASYAVMALGLVAVGLRARQRAGGAT